MLSPETITSYWIVVSGELRIQNQNSNYTAVYMTRKRYCCLHIDKKETEVKEVLCTVSWGIKATVALVHGICLRGTRPN